MIVVIHRGVQRHGVALHHVDVCCGITCVGMRVGVVVWRVALRYVMYGHGVWWYSMVGGVCRLEHGTIVICNTFIIIVSSIKHSMQHDNI